MYDHSLEIKYTDDAEYRNCIRRVFGTENSDDEMLYDDKTVSAGLDYIYEKTKSIPVFCDLYTIGAAKMISTDLEIGMAIVFSYDYFELFHLCLVDFLKDGVLKSESENYKNLHKKIS